MHLKIQCQSTFDLAFFFFNFKMQFLLKEEEEDEDEDGGSEINLYKK